MLQRLFTSKTRVKLLTIFLMNPERELYIRELVRLTNENINAIRRELYNLQDINLLTSRKQANTILFQVNKKMPIYQELTTIILKTEGVAKILKENLSKIGTIHIAFIYGSFANSTAKRQSDIDLFLIGNIDEHTLIPLIKTIEKQLSREINYVIFTSKEYQQRLKRNDQFVNHVIKEQKIMIIGDEHELN